jgi:hypothetical protein
MRAFILGLVLAVFLTEGAAIAQSTATNNPLTNEEISALRRAVSQAWNASGHKRIVTIRVRLNPDGTLAAPPKAVSFPYGPNFAAAAESAIKAIQSSQPFRMLKPGSYDSWKVMDIDFDPTTVVTTPQQPTKKFDIEKIKALLAKRKTPSTDPGKD